ncbi:hypothetical protein LDL_030 [Lactobacillus phage Ldl1]|uniref:Uncharacterized protein n=1 Tax=Lactobacillus phage Ldl1 TaxID=1552735 RepID=A0A0A7DMR9_9CAUD|nr:hypothetical protein VC66_gp30 [Lactobacillus phage Ldl1]AIS73888.1 hypothetical protein LDL_030 [Lactobacillus phage Ldl1]
MANTMTVSSGEENSVEGDTNHVYHLTCTTGNGQEHLFNKETKSVSLLYSSTTKYLGTIPTTIQPDGTLVARAIPQENQTAGTFYLELHETLNDGSVRIFPSEGHIEVYLNDSIASLQ